MNFYNKTWLKTTIITITLNHHCVLTMWLKVKGKNEATMSLDAYLYDTLIPTYHISCNYWTGKQVGSNMSGPSQTWHNNEVHNK